MDEFQFAKQIDIKTEAVIGAPPFLNCKPLLFGLENEVKFAVPSRLTSLFQHSQLQVVLAPIVDFFKNHRTVLLPNMAIASDGPVESVKFFYKRDIKQIKKVAVDSASHTSEMLLRLVLMKKYKLKPEFHHTAAKFDFENSVYDGLLVIGDTTFEMPKKYSFLDLGKAWKDLTGLPFVYACWMVNQDYDSKSLYKKLMKARELGLKNIERIVQQTDLLSPKIAHKYLTQNIRYTLGESEIEGLHRFQQLLKEGGYLESERELVFAHV